MTSTRLNSVVSPTSWVTHKIVASCQRSRARFRRARRRSRSSPRNGSSRIDEAALRTHHRPPEPHALPFAAGDERAPFAEIVVQPVRRCRGAR